MSPAASSLIEVSVVAHGARTPIGLQAPSSAAAVRAGVSRLGKHPYLVTRSLEPVTCAVDPELDPRLTGADRLLALALPALREACRPLAQAPDARRPVGIVLGLPEPRPGFSEAEAGQVRRQLERGEQLPFQLRGVEVVSRGHAAGLAALERAIEGLRAGVWDGCLVGGVDSYLQADTLEWLDGNRQLAGSRSRSGFVPGEGAAFCLLMTDRAMKTLGVKALARVRAVAVGEETKLIRTREVCLAEGLTAAVQRAVAGLRQPDERVDDVICDINGERYRGEEWGLAVLRVHPSFEDPLGYRAPADCWGDMGAASVPLFVVLACQAAARGYARGPLTLVWASSEGGLRGAALLETDAPRKRRRTDG